jgi:signal transduction histidine kinase/ligand-binding sensor domain-containing protein
MRFDGSKWERIGQRWGYRGDRAYEVFIDATGTLWVDDGSELMRLRSHEHQFEGVKEPLDRAVIRQSPAGTEWFVDAPHRLRARTPDGRVVRIENLEVFASPNAMLFDRDGDLWVASYRDGVKRVRRPDATLPRPTQIDSYRREQGLTSDYGLSILQDREGTVWVGTKAGLDQFRSPNFVPIELPKSTVGIAVVPAADGNVWVGSGSGPLARADSGGVNESRAFSSITCAALAPDGTIWLGGAGKLWRSGPKGFLTTAIPSSVGSGDVQAIAFEPNGAVWVAIIRAGLFRFAEGRWTQDGGIDGLPKSNPLVAANGFDGRLWFGYADDTVVMLDHAIVHRFDRRAGIDVGNVTAVDARGKEVWVGGERGLARFGDGRFVRVHADNPDSLTAISGLIETPDGDLWVAARKGVYRIDKAEVRRVVADAGHVVSVEFFDFTDGLPGVPQQHRPLPSAVMATDGRIWVATPDGLAWIDPRRISRNGAPPPVEIETLASADQHLRPQETMRLPAGTQNLSITYTALSLARPERVMFRYRLTGSSDHWSEPTNRREAFFTNLGPGRYRFDVVASNDAGVWNLEGKTMSFEIAPEFWQTTWFRLGCVLLATVVLYAIYLWHLRDISARLQQRLQERFNERERIARELHDTLLQSVQGLIMQFHALTRQGAESVPPALIDRALDKAEIVMIEGRNRVAALRDRGRTESDLPTELEKSIQEISAEYDVPCELQITGLRRSVEDIVQDDLIVIAREALFNAFRHAQARTITVVLNYRPDDLELRIVDDGRGISARTLSEGGKAGHFGLPGMHERAKQMCAKLEIRSKDPIGTVVDIVVPGHTAYRGRQSILQAIRKRLRSS